MNDDNTIKELAVDIENLFQTAVNDSRIDDFELRRILRFIAQVIQVVEQSFQDVLGTLVEIKLMRPEDISTPKLQELQRQLELLTSRSYFRDAFEVCSRLRHLRQNFDQFIEPSVRHIKDYGGYKGVLGLIQEGEGKIIRLIEQTSREISYMLENIDANSLVEIRRTASVKSEQLKSLLADLHELNGRILGYSGRSGFLELTRDRNELKRSVSIMIDKRDQSTTHGHRVSIVGNNTIEGTLTIANNVTNSKVNSIHNDTEMLEETLKTLLNEISMLKDRAKPSDISAIEQDAKTFVSEAKLGKPRAKWLELSADGLIEAAKAVDGIGSPIISLVKRIISLIVV